MSIICASQALAGTNYKPIPMRTKLRNELHDGWKSALFLLACLACFVLVGLTGRSLPPAIKSYAPNAVLIAVLGCLLTFVAVRLEGASLASVGLRLDGRFLRQFGFGMVGGGLLVAASAGLVCGLAGVTLVPVEAAAFVLQLKLIVMVLGGALFEELLFRGYAFQRAVHAMGRWSAIAAFGLLFSLAHLPGGSELDASMLVIAVAGLFLDCVIQSLILLRTGSLALPIGLHFAWNWLQQALGFGVSGATSTPGWFRPELGGQPGWLTGGAYGLEASMPALVVQVGLLIWLLRTAPSAPDLAEQPPVPA
jgi:uncharacterized protein